MSVTAAMLLAAVTAGSPRATIRLAGSTSSRYVFGSGVPAKKIGGSPSKEQEPTKEEEVNVLDPPQICLGKMEARLDGREGNVHSGCVQQDHKLDASPTHNARTRLLCRHAQPIHQHLPATINVEHRVFQRYL